MPTYVTIPKSEYQSLLQEVKRGVEVCVEISNLRLVLNTLRERLKALGADKVALVALASAVEACEDVARLRIDFVALERRLREFDQELTPVRPPSQVDIKAAFDNATDFATGKKKPPGSGGA